MGPGRVSLRWIALSYFITSGALAAAHALALVFHLRLVPAIAVYGLAAFVGGFAAGRTSRGHTVLEPALAAALVVASLFLCSAYLRLGDIAGQTLEPSFSTRPASLAFCAAVVGGILGELVQKKTASDKLSFPTLVASLILAGVVFFCFLVFAMALQLVGWKLRTGSGLLLAFASPLLAGMVVQAAFSFSAATTAVSGVFVCMGAFFVVFISMVRTVGPLDYVMIAIAGLAVTGVVAVLASLGSSSVWERYQSRLAVELPEAAIHKQS